MTERDEIYHEHDSENRADYLNGLAYDYGVPVHVVFVMADLLGPDEDFDGLISFLEDYER